MKDNPNNQKSTKLGSNKQSSPLPYKLEKPGAQPRMVINEGLIDPAKDYKKVKGLELLKS